MNRRVFLLVVALAAAPAALTGCTSTEEATGRQRPAPPRPPGLAITPAAKAMNVPVSAEIGTAVTGGTISSVVLTDNKGTRVDGALRPDGTRWVPAAPLAHKRIYTAKVTAANSAGTSTTQTASFTTMAEPARRAGTTVNLHDGRTYGVAMPVTVRFEEAVPAASRASVQRRLFVRTDPPQLGVWRWTADGRQAFYRAPDYWRPGTTITCVPGWVGIRWARAGTATATVARR